jgi:hypothetical protein
MGFQNGCSFDSSNASIDYDVTGLSIPLQVMAHPGISRSPCSAVRLDHMAQTDAVPSKIQGAFIGLGAEAD